MSGKYCVDANIFIDPWNASYPIRNFPSLWKEISQHQQDIILLKPIDDQIDPISNKTMPREKKNDRHPLRMWLEGERFVSTPVGDDVNALSLKLEKKYQIKENGKGADQVDITLIAYAKMHEKTVVTLENVQPQSPSSLSNYKIPLICKQEEVACISFIDLLGKLEIVI